MFFSLWFNFAFDLKLKNWFIERMGIPLCISLYLLLIKQKQLFLDDVHYIRLQPVNTYAYSWNNMSRCLFLGMSLSAGSSPLHSPKITPHTSPAPRRRSHTPNPANYMVPTTASDQGTHIIQKETVGGTTYFYTDNTPAPMAGMVCAAGGILLCVIVRKSLKTKVPTRESNLSSSERKIAHNANPAWSCSMTFVWWSNAHDSWKIYISLWSHASFHFSVIGTSLFLFPSQVFPTYHIYPPTAPHVAYMQPKANAPSFFMADELRQVFSSGYFSLNTSSVLFPRSHVRCQSFLFFLLGADKQTSNNHGPDWPLRKPRYSVVATTVLCECCRIRQACHKNLHKIYK